MAFFVTPAIADLDGDGVNEMIAGNGLYTLGAHDRARRPARGLAQAHRRLARRHARRSATGTATAGAEIAVVRRDGVLMVWRTAGRGRGPHRVAARRAATTRNTGVYQRLTRPANARSVAFIARL